MEVHPAMFSDYLQFAKAFPWFAPTVVFGLGAIVGSFLNVCIYRIPAGKSIVHPGSHCACGQPIAWYDNIPILSWFILRGRARCCGRPYSIRYPLVELLTAVLFLLCWRQFPAAKAICHMIFVSALICATFIDFDHLEIPDLFSVWLGVLGVVLSFAIPSLHDQTHEYFAVASLRSGAIGLRGLLIGSGLVLWIALIASAVLKKDAMGFGDVKFVGAIGAFCGWQGAIAAVFGGAFVGTIWFIAALLWQKITGREISLKSPEPGESASSVGFGAHIPFGPMLAIGGVLHLLFFHRYVDAYFAELGALF